MWNRVCTHEENSGNYCGEEKCPIRVTKKEGKRKMDKLFYMQDTRQFVGNSMYWWAKDAHGYTCDIRKAHVFTLEEARKHTQRDTDILWPKEHIDARISHHIDMQHCDKGIANTIHMDTVEK